MTNAFARSFSPDKKLAQLELVQLVSQTVVFGRHFFLRLRAMRRIAFFRSEFLQRAEIFDLAFQFVGTD